MAKLEDGQGATGAIKVALDDHVNDELTRAFHAGANTVQRGDPVVLTEEGLVSKASHELLQGVTAETLEMFHGLKLQQAKWVQRQLDQLAAMGGADAVAEAAGMSRLQFAMDEEADEPGVYVALLDRDPDKLYPVAREVQGTLEGFARQLQQAVLGDENEQLLAEADKLLSGI